MSLWQEIIASLAVILAGVIFVAWCLQDTIADVRWWRRHDR